MDSGVSKGLQSVHAYSHLPLGLQSPLFYEQHLPENGRLTPKLISEA